MADIDDPLVAPPPAEVPLKNAPLVRVIAQVRFPLIAALEQREFIAPLQEAIRPKYAVLRQEQAVASAIGIAVKPQAVWRFSDVEGHWRVSVAPDFLALETTAYTSRSDFIERLGEVVGALHRHAAPGQVDRLGIRYVDRLDSAALGVIETLVRPEMVGIMGTLPVSSVQHALSNAMFGLGDAQLTARWGKLPPRATFDPTELDVIDEASWILDFDMFSSSPAPFQPDAVIANATRYAERIYTFFRWAVTNEFLRRYGGTI